SNFDVCPLKILLTASEREPALGHVFARDNVVGKTRTPYGGFVTNLGPRMFAAIVQRNRGLMVRRRGIRRGNLRARGRLQNRRRWRGRRSLGASGTLPWGGVRNFRGGRSAGDWRAYENGLLLGNFGGTLPKRRISTLLAVANDAFIDQEDVGFHIAMLHGLAL